MNLEEQQEVVTLSEVCRACLLKTDNMKHLLGSNEEVTQIISKLSSVSNIEIKISDTFPCFLCSICEEKLKVSYEFQQLCQKSNNFILACLSASSIDVKGNSLKSLHFENSYEESDTQVIQNDTNEFISLVDNTGLEKEVLIIREVSDLSDTDEDVLEQTEVENILDETLKNEGLLNDTSSDDIQRNKEQVNENRLINDSDKRPPEVAKKTKYNQTMRLPQFLPQHVAEIIQETRRKILKHVKCLLCNFTATDSRSLSVHMTRLHKDIKKCWCIWCNKLFDNLEEHTKIDHKDDLKCALCGKYKMSVSHLVEHLASHSIQRNHMCTECGKSFISKRHLRLHSKTHTRPNETVIEALPENEEFNSQPKVSTLPQNFCEICKKRVRSLPVHLQNIHTDTPEEKKTNNNIRALCSFCGKGFKRIGKLTDHMRVHTGETPYQCSYCDKKVKTRMNLVIHERIHTGEKPYQCKFCNKRFVQSTGLTTHMRRHTGKPEKCPSCDKRFCRPSELRVHLRIHTGEKPYECNICGERFISKGGLNDHSRTHCDERPYKCNYCEKSFKHSTTLRSHTYIHLGKKPFQCSECNYSCRQRNCLTKHMRLRHNKKSNPDQQLHQCEVCEQYFTNYESFSIHFNNEHGSLEEQDKKSNTDPEVHKCEICDQYFLDYESFSVHYNDEHGSLERAEQNIISEGLMETVVVEEVDHLKEFT